MDKSEHLQDYIAKARQAEDYALQAADLVTRNTWLRIAVSYRDLAAFVEKNAARDPSWDQPAPSTISPAAIRN